MYNMDINQGNNKIPHYIQTLGILEPNLCKMIELGLVTCYCKQILKDFIVLCMNVIDVINETRGEWIKYLIIKSLLFTHVCIFFHMHCSVKRPSLTTSINEHLPKQTDFSHLKLQFPHCFIMWVGHWLVP